MSKRICDYVIPSPKRLRGGGVEDDMEFPEEEPDFVEDIDYDLSIPSEMEGDDEINLLPQDLTETMKSKWCRPPVSVTSNDVDLSFQWLDMDVIGGKPLKENPNPTASKVVGASTGQVPILRIYGVTMEGNSVAAFLHGFTPYCYFAVPSGLDTTDRTLGQLRTILNQKLLQAATRGADTTSDMVLSIRCVENYTSLLGFQSKHNKFLKIHVAMPTMVPTLKRVMEQGINWPGQNYDTSLSPFECNVPFVLRFMIDRGVSGAEWLTLPKATYQIRRGAKQTHCQVS
jgi:DNA polymerase delta subunit 1